jgi:hypothetical protein
MRVSKVMIIENIPTPRILILHTEGVSHTGDGHILPHVVLQLSAA